MAEALLGAIVEKVMSKLISVASEQIVLACDFKESLKRLGESLEMIKAFLQDAEERQTNNNSVKLWLETLKDIAYKADDVLDEFAYEILRRKVFRNQIGRKVGQSIWSPAESYRSQNPFPVSGGSNEETISFPGVSNIVGRENDVSKVVDLLVNPKDEQVVCVVPIGGMGGLGKTTLARLVYNEINVERHFDVKFWICVSDHFDVKRILRETFDHFIHQQTLISESMNAIVEKLKEKMKEATGGKEHIKYLLVLDDVWNIEKWEELKNCLIGVNRNKGNIIIVTTRSQDVASTVQAFPNQRHQPGRLKDSECWSIIKEHASISSRMSQELDLIGMKIAKQCQGVPLVGKVIAGTMRGVEMSHGAWLKIQKSNVWDSVESVLKLSFDRLSSPSIKKCFAYCAVFPKDYCFEKEQLIQLWMAEGFLGSSMEMVDMDVVFHEDVFPFHLSSAQSSWFFPSQTHIPDSDFLLLSSPVTSFPNSPSVSLPSVSSHTQSPASTGVVPSPSSVSRESHDVPVDYSGQQSPSSVQSDMIGLNQQSGFVQPELVQPEVSGIPSSSSSVPIRTSTRVNYYSMKTEIFSNTPAFIFLTGYCTSDTLIFRENSTFTTNDLSHIRYLSICYDEESLARVLTEVAPKLHSLFFENDVFTKVPRTFTSLRVLKFSGVNYIRELPASLGELKHLRYLDISKTPIRALPRSIIELYNSQTLRFLGCLIITFPNGLRNLTSLRHIHFDRHSSQPIELRHLTSLQTLPMFSVGENISEHYHTNGANLHQKEKLRKVILEWSRSESDHNTKEVMEGLQPHSNLQSLIVRNFPGESFPSWMLGLVGGSNTRLLLLDNLIELELIDCINCECLPPLGQLHNLRFLKLKSLEKVKHMGNEFYCNGTNDGVPLTGQCLSLEKLRIEKCSSVSNIGDGLATCVNLKELTIVECSNLCILPKLEGFSNLQSLHVSECRELETVPITGAYSSLQKVRISGCRKLSKIGDGLSTSTCLKELILHKCCNLTAIPDLKGCSSLQNLSVYSCNKLEDFPIVGLGSLHFVQDLTIMRCPRLRSVPDNNLVSLAHLRKLMIGGFSEELEDFPGFSSIQHHNESLRELHLIRWEKLQSLPHQLQYLSALEELTIEGFQGIKDLPD
ncbi:hypothetical protein GQ457_09G022390 [Hibiscus cannabinus]